MKLRSSLLVAMPNNQNSKSELSLSNPIKENGEYSFLFLPKYRNTYI